MTVGSRAFQNARLQKKFKKEADAALAAAHQAYANGRLADVETLCRRILEVLPEHFDTLHLLGVCLSANPKRLEEAEQVLRGAIAISPRAANVYCDLGTVLFDLKRYQDARACQEKGIALNPNFAMALTNLGNTLMHLMLPLEAIELHERAIRLKPDYADAYCNRGMVELRIWQSEQALQSFERALAFQPNHHEALVGRGMALLELRHYAAAEAVLNTALARQPNNAKVLAHRGRLHLRLMRLEQAERDIEAALGLDPDLEMALREKARVSLLLNKPTQAMAACHKLLEQNPKSETAISLMGSCFASFGDIATALEQFDRALELKPDFEDAIHRKIFTLDFLPEADFALLQGARKYWWDNVGSRIPQRKPRPRDLDPDRRLVVGYVSADFRRHSAAYIFMPVLRHSDHTNFETVCYSSSPLQDEMTDEFRAVADRWVDAAPLTDEQLTDHIEADGIDILVDLSGHSLGNRLGMFARKPAPIQVSAWGAPTGTGLKTIDYIFADPVTIPLAARPEFAEKIHDLPCMLTMIEPAPGLYRPDLPMLRNGHVTFGTFNRIEKISNEVLAVWSKLLRELPGSKLVVKHASLDDTGLRDGLIARFVEHGVSPDSVVCLGASIREEHLKEYAHIDISLDTFPQNGGAGTWESLHMGVPVIAKLGQTTSSRAAGGIVKAVGLDDWVVEDDETYIAVGKRFSADPAGLATLRRELPARITASAAGNGATYTRHVEAAYRRFWREYCAAQAH
ncbi:tetratricopeptide repeat protein [Bradyrhizobium manausense]|uniref:O-linked N-acetylglucosamine transferase, SPINDLY family protein n=1 Tax=Bradyrhizobium manausense TaxID=989370 RepID=UPI001BAD8615|nr:tetratricopeptide repeat protein [Bradyrhizobium manausense]MBR0789056.1 tetratricopeptide repeat protein [Bradyrhizobium manausense]